MYEQNASYLVKHSDLEAKNLNKICLIVQKVLKWAGWALFLVRVAGLVTVTRLEVTVRGRSGPKKSQPEPSLM